MKDWITSSKDLCML